MVAKSILHGWLIFFSIAVVITGFMFVKEGGLRKPQPFNEERVIDQPDIEATQTTEETEAPQPTEAVLAATAVAADERQTQPIPEGGPLLLPADDVGVNDTAAVQTPSEGATAEVGISPATELEQDNAFEPEVTPSQTEVQNVSASESQAPTVETSDPAKVEQEITEPITQESLTRQDCKLLTKAPALTAQQFDEATSIHTFQLAREQQITVPFPARIVKVYESAHSGHTLQLVSLDGSRALMLGGFSADLQTLRLRLPLDCGAVLAPLSAANKLHVQLRDTAGKEWWEGEVIDPAELF